MAAYVQIAVKQVNDIASLSIEVLGDPTTMPKERGIAMLLAQHIDDLVLALVKREGMTTTHVVFDAKKD